MGLLTAATIREPTAVTGVALGATPVAYLRGPGMNGAELATRRCAELLSIRISLIEIGHTVREYGFAHARWGEEEWGRTATAPGAETSATVLLSRITIQWEG